MTILNIGPSRWGDDLFKDNIFHKSNSRQVLPKYLQVSKNHYQIFQNRNVISFWHSYSRAQVCSVQLQIVVVDPTLKTLVQHSYLILLQNLHTPFIFSDHWTPFSNYVGKYFTSTLNKKYQTGALTYHKFNSP